MNVRMVRIMAYASTACFLVIHIAMFFLFTYYDVEFMARFNIFSIAFYVLMFFVIHRGLWRTYSIAVYLEVVVHMSLAVYFVGWDCGFQVTLIGMNILLFYAEYVGRSMPVKYVHAAPMAVIGLAGYLFSYVISMQRPAPDPLPDVVAFWLQIGWGVTVFVIAVVFLQIFVLLTFRSEKLLSTQVTHDRLTGLPNRYFMSDYLNNQIGLENLKSYWIAMIDIDDFKKINDTYGHNCGDHVLVTLADVVRSGISDVQVCRWGGEEFLMVGQADNMEEQFNKVDRLRKAIEEHGSWYEEMRLNFTVTIGMAVYESGQSISEWINSADKKLYEGKCSGKNKVVL